MRVTITNTKQPLHRDKRARQESSTSNLLFRRSVYTCTGSYGSARSRRFGAFYAAMQQRTGIKGATTKVRVPPPTQRTRTATYTYATLATHATATVKPDRRALGPRNQDVWGQASARTLAMHKCTAHTIYARPTCRHGYIYKYLPGKPRLCLNTKLTHLTC